MTTITNSNGHPITGTTAQRAAITSWEPGEYFYDTTLGKMLVYSGSAFVTSGGDVADDTAVGRRAMKSYRATYDWAVDGGAIGTITPVGSVNVPVGFIVYGGLLEVITAATVSGSTPTIAVQLQAANDLITATAYSSSPWSTTGIKAIIPVSTAATAVQVTSTAKDLKVVIASAATLTALKFNVHLVGFQGG